MKNRILFSRARRLRSKLTIEEKLLWEKIRPNSGFLVKFRRQHIIEPYILDFYSPSVRVAVELDGMQHVDKKAEEYDRRRTTFLKERGILVVRFWNVQIRKELKDVVENLFTLCGERRNNLQAPYLSGHRSSRR